MNDNEIWVKVDAASHKTPEQLDSLRLLTLVIYILYAVSWFNGLTALVAIVLNYVKREDAMGTIYESHFRWQMRTFWWSLLWAVVGFVTVYLLVGFLVLGILLVWLIYRLVKGLLYWSERRPMPI